MAGYQSGFVTMTIESWANAQLSADLPGLASGGENETVEFKREMPKQVRDLAKEIAAFASTNGGKILLGVDDDGTIVGIHNAHDPTIRDEYGLRVVGLCQVIDPPVRPDLSWASADGACVLVITVEKGSEPLYYVDSRAYIRHGTASRPATPAEIRAATSTSASGEAEKEAGNHPELSALAAVLVNIRRWCDTDPDMRSLKPWTDEWSANAGAYAATLRDIAISDWAIENHADERLEVMADQLDEIEQFQHFIGGGGDFDEVCETAGATAAELMRDLIDPVGISKDTQREVLGAIAKQARKLTQMWSRAGKDIFDGRVERAQKETYDIGKQIATWSYFPISIVPENMLSNLRRIGLGLVHLVALRIYMDGGASLQHIVDEAQILVIDLNASIESFAWE